MKPINSEPLIGIFIFLFLILTSALQALTVTKTYSGSTVDIDGTADYGVALTSVEFVSADFYTGAIITKVTTSVFWTKTDGTTCAGPLTGNAFHNETNFRLDSPVGNVILATPNTWSGGTDIGDVTTTFEQSATNSPSNTPVDGIFKPNGGDLNDFNGDNPIGLWNLSAGDTADNDPLCVHSYTVSITVPDDTDGDGIGDNIDDDDDNDGILDSTERGEVLITETNSTTGIIDDNTCFDRTFTIVESGIVDNSITLDIKIDHTYRADLDITLTSPQATSVDLTSDNGSSSDNLYVLFDDTASSSIVGDTSTQPPTQTLSPEVALATFNGENFQGIWTLQVCDDAGADQGTFNEATLSIDYKGSDLDTDGDGIQNQYDLDSDNDGIPDNIEAQETASYITPSGGGSGITDANSNGLDDNYESSQGGTDLTPSDSDSDGVFDFMDSDSDNDRVSDCMEGNNVAVSNKMCPLQLSDIGGNGLDTALGGANDYLDVNGNVDNPTTGLYDFDASTPEVSYRETSICGNLIWELKADQWKTIATPCDTTSWTIDDLFSTTLGTKCTTDNPSEVCDWAMYKQLDFSGSSSSGYTIVMLTETMNPSTGYWIISGTDATVIIDDDQYTTTEVTKIVATNHSVASSDFTDVFRTGTLAATSSVHKFLLGHPFSGQLILKDLFVTGNDGTNYYPMPDSANTNLFIYSTVYVYDHIGTDTQNYVAKTPGTPGFDGLVENGIGFWLGGKADSGATLGVDFPYYK